MSDKTVKSVLDSISLKPVNDCKIIFYDKNDFYLNTYSNLKGSFFLTIPQKEKVYVNIISKDHLFYSKQLDLEEESKLDFELINKLSIRG